MYDYLKLFVIRELNKTKYYFNKSLMNKKTKLKLELYELVKDLYIYMTFIIIPENERVLIDKFVDPFRGCDKHDLPTKGITKKELSVLEKDLYLKYLGIINRSLSINEEKINLTKIDYFLKVMLDMLESSKNYPKVSFIYQNDIKHIIKLKEILKLLIEYSKSEDYFTFQEFQEFIHSYRENFHIVDIDIFKNLNKYPKRLKRRKYVNDREN